MTIYEKVKSKLKIIENPLSLRAKVCIAASNDLQISYTIVLLVINVLLSIIASLGNTLIFFALHKECALHPPSKLLFRCLALTDLLNGCISQPLYILYLVSLLTKHQDWRGDLCFYFATFSIITSNTLCLVSLLTSTAISIDRLLALNLGLGYRRVVTFKRTYEGILISLRSLSWQQKKESTVIRYKGIENVIDDLRLKAFYDQRNRVCMASPRNKN